MDYKYCLVNNSRAYISEIPLDEQQWKNELVKINIKIKNLKFSNNRPYMAKLFKLNSASKEK